MTAGRAAAHGLFGRLNDRDRELVAEAIERVGMTEHARTSLARLSGGQQQRAFIAKALAAEPELLVLDEPTTGVDVDAQEAFADLLSELHRETGTTILYVSLHQWPLYPGTGRVERCIPHHPRSVEVDGTVRVRDAVEGDLDQLVAVGVV